MRIKCLVGLGCAAVSLGIGSAAQGALQVALGKVNTSVGLLPTNATNKWKLQTDPVIVPDGNAPAGDLPPPNLSLYIPTDGMLDTSFDASKFQLALNPTTGKFDFGYTVQGLGAYQILGFDVKMTGSDQDSGGFIDVQLNPSDLTHPIYSDIGDAGGTETGEVDNIHFQFVPSLRTDNTGPVSSFSSGVSQPGSASDLFPPNADISPLPANVDQLFFQLNLVRLDNLPNFDPGIGYTFGGPGTMGLPPSFLTIAPTDPSNPAPPITTIYSVDPITGDPTIEPSSSVPEPASAALAVVVAGLVALRRPKSPARCQAL